MGGVSSQET
jgi:dual specificity tyrosine-phosphorylation-regulated kinase 2/3/4